MQAEKRKDRYVFLMPHEIPLMQSYILDFYKEIGFTEGSENIKVFIDDIVQTVQANQYQFFLVGLDKDNKILGYTWYYVDRNIIEEPYLTIEHDYIAPDIRNSIRGARVHKKLIENMIETYKRCGCTYANTVVRSEKLKESRERLGFEVVEHKMRFTGTGEDFEMHNPIFVRYVKS